MMNKISSLKTAFVAALMIGSASVADAYSLGGGGGTGARGYADRIVLDYPDGSEQRFLLPRLPHEKATKAQQQEYYDAAVIILGNYMRDIMPQMSDDKREEFAWIIDRLAEDYVPLVTDAESLSKEIGYDYALVERYQLESKIKDFRYIQESLNEPFLGSGYDLYPGAAYKDEHIIDRFNEVLTELKAEFPHHRAYQTRPMTYDVLYDMRRELGAEIAKVLVMFGDDVDRGRIDPQIIPIHIQDFISMTTLLLSDPTAMDDRDQYSTGKYNALIPQYIDEALEQNHGLSEDERNALYQKLFTIRHSYDLRPIANEDDFMAGRDVIGAPSP